MREASPQNNPTYQMSCLTLFSFRVDYTVSFSRQIYLSRSTPSRETRYI